MYCVTLLTRSLSPLTLTQSYLAASLFLLLIHGPGNGTLLGDGSPGNKVRNSEVTFTIPEISSIFLILDGYLNSLVYI
mgnify:CR=1 FL=1